MRPKQPRFINAAALARCHWAALAARDELLKQFTTEGARLHRPKAAVLMRGAVKRDGRCFKFASSVLEAVEPLFGREDAGEPARRMVQVARINERDAAGAVVGEGLVSDQGIGRKHKRVSTTVIEVHGCYWGPMIDIILSTGLTQRVAWIAQQAGQIVRSKDGEAIRWQCLTDLIIGMETIVKRGQGAVVRRSQQPLEGITQIVDGQPGRY